jgi:hypothetical protein
MSRRRVAAAGEAGPDCGAAQLRDEGLSILLVEHDMDLVMEITDRIVVMEFGTKLIEGRRRRCRLRLLFERLTSGRSIDVCFFFRSQRLHPSRLRYRSPGLAFAYLLFTA